MDRRTFLGGLGATVVAMPAIASSDPVVAGDEQARVVSVPERVKPDEQRVYIIGLPAHDKYMIKVKQMSDDIFDRLIASVDGTSYQVTLADKVHALYIQGNNQVTEQWHTAFRPRLDEMIDGFPIERFRRETSGWRLGPRWDPNAGSPLVPSDVAFKTTATGRRVVGMPYLPKGVDFAVHYIDCKTGMVMRAVAHYDIDVDGIALRCDVLVG